MASLERAHRHQECLAAFCKPKPQLDRETLEMDFGVYAYRTNLCMRVYAIAQ
jgi:hypothetical protein